VVGTGFIWLQKKYQWRALVKTVMNFPVSLNVGKYLRAAQLADS
jgi:hypothetical protein